MDAIFPEAWIGAYEAFQALRTQVAVGEMKESFKRALLHRNEAMAIAAANDEFKSTQGGDHKYARLGRKWLPQLRRIFWTSEDGARKQLAQGLIDSIEGEATIPLNDFELPAAFVDGESSRWTVIR